ncbi:MAG TPA: hypothetical protein VI260_11370, partial [Blastocatellia bacterium]
MQQRLLVAAATVDPSPAFMVFEKIMQPPSSQSRSDHVSLARLFKAGSTNAYPFSVAAATVDTDHRYQPS